jgi:hypothetical protein
MGMKIRSLVNPQIPFLVLNEQYIMRFDGRRVSSEAIRGFAFDDGRFKKDAMVYDVDCRKFPVTGAVKQGWSMGFKGLHALLNVFYPPPKRFYNFEFLVGEPEQLTFEQAREEIIEHICRRRWANQMGKTPDILRKDYAAKATMAELIEGIGFLGKDPF